METDLTWDKKIWSSVDNLASSVLTDQICIATYEKLYDEAKRLFEIDFWVLASAVLKVAFLKIGLWPKPS